MALAPLAPIDRATLAYVAVALGFTLARGPRTWPAVALLPLWLLLAGLLAAVVAPAARRAGRAGLLLGELYPCFLIVAFYTEVGLVNAATGVSHDARVQRWEALLFGGQPSLDWIRAFPSPAWSTAMHATYLSYYGIHAAAPLGLWLTGRRGAARATVLLMMATFYVCWTIFFAFPVAGPRYLFPPADNAATAVPIAVLTRRLLEGGSAWGTAFPSSHVAAALVAAGSAWRGWRPLGAVLLPAALLLPLATVYGQLHYAVDALAGAALAAVVLIAGRSGEYHSDFRSTKGRAAAPGEAS